MTKEEKIKESWGNISGKTNEDGWLYFGYCVNGWDDIEDWLDENNLISDENYYDMTCKELDNGDLILVQIRPKSLQGIKNNNGWIKIESEDDLPKEVINCWFATNNGIYLGYYTTRGYFVNEGEDIELKFITHYQPIEKPKPPLY